MSDANTYRTPPTPANDGPAARMSNAEFVAAMERLGLLVNAAVPLLASVDLDAFLERCDDAQAIGPFADPTLWLKGTNRLRALQEVALATRDWLTSVRKAGLVLTPPAS